MTGNNDISLNVRTVFLSDFHLGTRGCQAELILDFLKSVEADTYYLIGDIVDGWRLKESWFWPQSHNDVIQKILRKVRKGSRVVYLPGNHDEFLRDYLGSTFGGIELVDEITHISSDGAKYLVLHGDKFDIVVRHARWLAHLGDWAYDIALVINTVVGKFRRRFGMSYWSLAGWGKTKVKSALNFVTSFEEAVINDAKRLRLDGVICGHIHTPSMKTIDEIKYVNTGDWVDSCSALIEHHNGQLEIIYWHDIKNKK